MCRPYRASSIVTLIPGLTPWAIFFRPSGAGVALRVVRPVVLIEDEFDSETSSWPGESDGVVERGVGDIFECRARLRSR